MGLFSIFKRNDKNGKLEDKMCNYSDSVVQILTKIGYKLDYSLESMREIDRYIDELKKRKDNEISKADRIQILLKIAAYVGQTIIKLYNGEWDTDNSTLDDWINIQIKLEKGYTAKPVSIVLARYSNGNTNSVYSDVFSLNINENNIKTKNTLKEDIIIASNWIVEALNSSGYKVDYSLESMKEIDRFFDEQSEENGIIGKNRGQILFSLGSYIGQTIINLYGGEWITDDNDSNGEVNITVKLKNDSTILTPVIRCLKRYTNGKEDSIYAYVYALGKEKKNI